MIDYDALAQRIHDNAVDKGFWASDRDYGEMIALMHSELSEALEEHREGRPAFHVDVQKMQGGTGAYRDWAEWWRSTDDAGLIWPVLVADWTLEHGKPEGAAVELADGIIRALDTLHSIVPGRVAQHVLTPELGLIVPARPENFGHALAFAHCTLSRSFEAHVTPSPFDEPGADARMLGAFIQWCEAMICDLGVDVEAVVEAKMAYNATRPHMHGKAY